jgi:predicted transcriptional regulator
MTDPTRRSGERPARGREECDRPDEEALRPATRREIYETVAAAPGIHFSGLKRRLDAETGLVQYHLRELERGGVLESEHHRGRRRVYVAGRHDERERTALAALRAETARRLVVALLEEAPARNGDLAATVDVTPATVSWHLDRLEGEGVVETVSGKRHSRYALAAPERIADILWRHGDSFEDPAVERWLDRHG